LAVVGSHEKWMSQWGRRRRRRGRRERKTQESS
jgi:hypothetical protein